MTTSSTGIGDVTPRPTTWTTGRIIEKELPHADMVRLRMHVEDRQRHWPGQHYLIRLRAPDDYTAQRSYSVASDDDDPLVEFLVEKLPGGEVSEFLADVAEVGDVLELRGPIGRWFIWDTRTPALCLVGGTGVVPAVAMTRAARRLGRTDLLRVVAVGRDRDELPVRRRARAVRRHAGLHPSLERRQAAGSPDRRRGRAVAGGGRARLRLRLVALRRVRRGAAARVRRGRSGDQGGAVRRHGLIGR